MKSVRPFFVLILLLLSCDVFNSGQEEDSCSTVFVVVEEPPVLITDFISIRNEIRYPIVALKSRIEGRVMTQFVIDSTGTPIRVKVIRGIGGGADEEAIRVTKMLEFKPGKQGGVPVCTMYSIPITFRLPF